MCAGLLPTAFEIGAFDLDVNKVRQLKAKNLKIFATLSDLISGSQHMCWLLPHQ